MKFMDNEIFQSSKYFEHEIFLTCLNHETHDEILNRNLSILALKHSLPSDDVVKVTTITDFKQGILDHMLLCPALETESSTPLAGCLRSAVNLAEIVPKIRSSGAADSVLADIAGAVPPSSLSRLAVSYLYLVVSALSQRHNQESRSIQRLLEDDEECGSTTFERVQSLVSTTDDLRMASVLLEMMSLLIPVKNEEFLQNLIETSFRVLHTTYAHSTGECAARTVPYSVLMVASLENRAMFPDDIQRILFHTVWRCSDAPETQLGSALELQRSLLLRHFGLLCVSRDRWCLFRSHIQELVSDFVVLVSAISDGKDGKDTTNPQSLTRMSPKKASAKKKNSVFCLTWNTFHGYFETLLHVAVAGFAVLQPEPSTAHGRLSPYSSLQDAAVVFQTLVLTYGDHLEAFPRKTVTAVFQASRLILEALPLKIAEITEWRNRQPLRKPTKYGDSGCLNYLRGFIDIMASSMCASLLLLGNRWRNHKDISNTAQRGKTLCLLAEKAATSLKDLAAAHKIPFPCFEVNRDLSSGVSQEYLNDCKTPTSPLRKKLRLASETQETIRFEDSSNVNTHETENLDEVEFTASDNWGPVGLSVEDAVVVTAEIRPSK